MKRSFGSLALGLTLAVAGPACAQDLQDRAAPPPPPESALPTPATDDQIDFSSDLLEYDSSAEIVTASGEVRLLREGNRLRADRVTWNRKTGQVVADGNIAVTNPQGDIAYGDRIELTDSLKDGVVDNMLVVLDEGGRIAATRGTRSENGVVTVESAAYTPCSVTNSAGCPKTPSWKITALRVRYDPTRKRIRYTGAGLTIFGLPTIPLPSFSHSIGDGSDSGLLAPSIRLDRVNGLEVAVPYYFNLAPNRDLTITPHVFTAVLPMLQADYRSLSSKGAYRVQGFATVSRRSDDLVLGASPTGTERSFRGYVDTIGRFQLDPNWAVSGSLRYATDQTFLRRYDISRDDRLRNNVTVERIDRDLDADDQRLGGADIAGRRRSGNAADRTAGNRLSPALQRAVRRCRAGAAQHAGDQPERGAGYAAGIRRRAVGPDALHAAGTGSDLHRLCPRRCL